MPEELRELVKAKAAPRYTGERIARTRPRTYRKIVGLLAAQVPILEIATSCRIAEKSVVAIREANAESISERKLVLSSLAYRIASGAGEVIENDIAAGKLHGSAAIVAFGVATDKLLALSDQPTARLAVDVSGAVNIVAQFQAVTDSIKQAVARPVPPALVVPADHPPASST